MKAMKQHPLQALSAARIRALNDPGRYADGNGLYLIVGPSGAKRWLLRTMVRGKRCDMGLGGLKVVSLAEAREKAATYRSIARHGGDPLGDRRRQQLPVLTFEQAARRVHAEHGKTWQNAKHGQQWINTLVAYVFSVFGDRPVNQIETSDVLRALSPIWLTKPETARRVRQRIRAVLDWAKVAGSALAITRLRASAKVFRNSWTATTTMPRCPTKRCPCSSEPCARATRASPPNSPSNS